MPMSSHATKFYTFREFSAARELTASKCCQSGRRLSATVQFQIGMKWWKRYLRLLYNQPQQSVYAGSTDQGSYWMRTAACQR